MQIIKDKNDVVVFAGDGFELTESGLIGKGFKAPGVKLSDHTIVTVPSIPTDFVGGHYIWTTLGGFTKTTYGEAAEVMAQDVLLSKRKSELAGLRYQKETAGVIVNGAIIRTDRESQAMISGAYNACQINEDRTIDFKGVNGWVRLDATEITVIASAVADHVQACFTREMELSAALDVDIDTDITTGWPE